MKAEDILLMLKDGTIDDYLESLGNHESVTVQKLADINFPTGIIIAADPLALFDTEPFEKKILPGKYPVFLYIHHLENEDKRVTAAETRLKETLPVRFEMALCKDQKLDELKAPDEFYGYAVDTGTGSFMDKQTCEQFERILNEKKGVIPEIDKELDRTYIYTYSTAVYTVPDTKNNLAIFSTGYGDGCYASYWGYDSLGDVCCLISEFQTIDIDETAPAASDLLP